MSNPIHSLKDNLKAPAALVEATQKGEPVKHRKKDQRDTPSRHVKRFSVAFVVYACAAILLVGGMTLLPKVLRHQDPVGSQPGDQSEVHSDRLSNQTEPSNLPRQEGWLPDLSTYDYAAKKVRGYSHSDLIWGNEANYDFVQAKIMVIESKGDTVTMQLADCLANVSDNPGFAVKAELSVSKGNSSNSEETVSRISTVSVLAKTALENALPADREWVYPNDYFVLTLNDLRNLDAEDLLNSITKGVQKYKEDVTAPIDMTITFSVAFQAIEPITPNEDSSIPFQEGWLPDTSTYSYLAKSAANYVRPDLIWGNDYNCSFWYAKILKIQSKDGTVTKKTANALDYATTNPLVAIYAEITLPEDSPYKPYTAYLHTASEVKQFNKVLGDVLNSAVPFERQQIEGTDYCYYVMSLDDLKNLDEKELIAKVTKGIQDVTKKNYGAMDVTVTFSVAYQPVPDSVQKVGSPYELGQTVECGQNIDAAIKRFGQPLVKCEAENFVDYTADVTIPGNTCDAMSYNFTKGWIKVFYAESTYNLTTLKEDDLEPADGGFWVSSGDGANVVRYAPNGEDSIIFYGVFASSVSCEDIEALMTSLVFPVDLNS